jgi:hypothetical protein
MRRLLRIRELGEDQSRLALESALGELNQLEAAFRATAQRGRRGRRLLSASVQTGNLLDRVVGLEETRTSGLVGEALLNRVAVAESHVVELRGELLANRVRSRQTGMIVRSTEARDAQEGARRGQQELDDWHRRRSFTDSES